MNEHGDAADVQRREARRRAQRNEVLAAIRPARRSWQRLLDLQDNTSTESTRDGTTSSNTDVADGEEEEDQSRTWTQSMRWLLHRGDHEADDHPMHQRIMDLRALAIQNRMIRLDNSHHARGIDSQAANATAATTTSETNGELSPLMTAAAMGNIDQLTELLQTHTWSRIRGDRGQTPLHEASKNGHVEAVRLLFELCSGIEMVRDNDRLSPLHYAAESGYLDVVSLLLSFGVEVNTKSRFQTTALHVASRNGHLGVVEVLIEHGADINQIDNKKRTALHKACLKGHRDVAAYLIRHGAEVDAKTSSGQTALCKALKGRHAATVQLLLEKGAKIKERDKEHGSLLIRALETDFLDALFLVIRLNPQYWFSIQDRYVP
jgi:ankyrin repeat protein